MFRFIFIKKNKILTLKYEYVLGFFFYIILAHRQQKSLALSMQLILKIKIKNLKMFKKNHGEGKMYTKQGKKQKSTQHHYRMNDFQRNR